MEVYVESQPRAPREIWLDLDATDDPCTVARRVDSSMGITPPVRRRAGRAAMAPEAYLKAGPVVGLATPMGVLAAMFW